MAIGRLSLIWKAALLLCVATVMASAQSFRVQCPVSTITHPAAANNNAEPAYNGPTTLTAGASGYQVPTANVNGAIKCQQISGGDGYATMGDGTQTYMFSFGPLSGLTDMANGLPGTEFPSVFNALYTGATPLRAGDPATTVDASGAGSFTFNGAVGLIPDVANLVTIYDISEVTGSSLVVVQANAPLGLNAGDKVVISGTGLAYDNTASNPTWTITTAGYTMPAPCTATPAPFTCPGVTNYGFPANYVFTFNLPSVLAQGDVLESQTATAATPPAVDGHVDPRQIMDVGVMNGNIPAPLMAIDEDDEFFLTLSNVGMIMRPDLFEQHTVHFHGYPNASSFYDGVPDASVAINIGGSFTYYYLAPDAGTYFWHCHITPPEHLQMGMVGQLYVRPRQNRVPLNASLYSSLQSQQNDPRTSCTPAVDMLCSNSLPAVNTGVVQKNSVVGNSSTNPNYNKPYKYAYNDGDGSTAYDVEYPIQIHGFDPNFHFVGMTFNPENFAGMKDKYFLLNGRSYPDTITAGAMQTVVADGSKHFSQPLSAIVSIPAGGKALLRISDLDVTEYQTLASLGIPMHVVGYNAKLLRDQEGHNLDYYTNSITLAGGESLDVILDASDTTKYKSGQIFYLYTPNLDHLANDAENFGGLMTEVRIN
jgi:FtsP/CotA-like multicopper oxidase with cupredoxin domain